VGQNELKQNDFCRVYPNPSSGLLRFSFTLTAPSGINFEIVNCLGQKIKGPEPGYLSTGTHEIIWNANHLPDGIYYYRLQTYSQTTSGRIILTD
ncbi:MAG: T9SS type A sorting domain-containing protein, partial [Bacteroidales bacterium]